MADDTPNLASELAGTALGATLAGRRVLVTGHTGFKGAWLCHALLAAGAHVTGYSIDVPTDPSAFAMLELDRRLTDIRGDIRDRAATRAAVHLCRPALLIHMAAQSLVRPGYANPADTFAVNVQGTVEVLDAVRTLGPSPDGQPVAVLVVTSDKCYWPSETPTHHTEADRLGGVDPYSASKAAAEIVAQAYARSYFDRPGSGVRLATARAGNVIGGGDWSVDRLVPDIARGIAADQTIPIRHPRAVRPWQHVLDALSGYLWLCAGLLTAADDRCLGTGSAKPEAHDHALCSGWNFGPDETDAAGAVTVWQIAQQLLKALGRGKLQDLSAQAQPQSGAAVASREKETQHLALSIAKARAGLGWRPTWTTAEAVEHTAGWYRRVMIQGHNAAGVTDEQWAGYVRDAAARGLPWAQPAAPGDHVAPAIASPASTAAATVNPGHKAVRA